MKYMVLYTDGSAKPNPGETGYGIHGYIGKEGTFKTVENKWLMTDKGYLPKKEAKKHILIEPELIIERYGKLDNSDTNNQAELDAIIFTLELAIERLEKDDKLHIIADSKYVTNYASQHLNNNTPSYNGNESHLSKLRELLDKIEFEITISRVDGHIGILGNEEADRLSNMGRYLNLNGKKEIDKILIMDPKDYWFYEPDINAFLAKNKKLLITLKNTTIFDNKNLHCVTNYKKKHIEEIGKKDPEIKYSLIRSEKDVEEIDLLLKYSKDNSDMEKPYAISLADILNKKIARRLHIYKEDYLRKIRTMFDMIVTAENNPVVLATEIFPESLSWYTVKYFKELYKIKNEIDNDNINKIDITDIIFDNLKKPKIIIDTKDVKIQLIMVFKSEIC